MRPQCLGAILSGLLALTGQGVAAEARRARVLVIGIDGVRWDCLQIAATPNLDQLAADGASRFDITTLELTRTGPAWSTVLTGVWNDKHGVIDNSFDGARFDLYPHHFWRLRERCASPCTASFISWATLNNALPPDASRFNLCPLADPVIAQLTADYLYSCHPDIVFVHLRDVDATGHTHGFGPQSTEYLAAIEVADSQVGQMVDAIRSRPEYPLESWLIIVTTDHGGKGIWHGGTSPEETTIFMIVSGPAAEMGTIDPPPQLVDVVPTVFDFFGVEVDPAWGLDGASRGLDPYRPAVGFPCNTDSELVFWDTFASGLCRWNLKLPECDEASALWPFDP